MEVGQLIGRFHPLLVHFPIGILIFVYLLECLSRFGKLNRHSSTIRIGLLIGLLFSILTCITGLVLSNSGDYTGALINQHKWLGIGMTALTAFVYFLHSKREGGQSVKLSESYFLFFTLSIILLTITGHKGGSLTHGEGFLFAEPKTEVQIENVESAQLYRQIIFPIIKSKCTSCHNPSKAKGKLDMTSFSEMMKGGEEGEVIVIGEASKSSLVQLIHLPIEEDRHMPPKSKRQLSEDEILLLAWWIDQGASENALVGELKLTDEIKKVLSKFHRPKDEYTKLNVSPVDAGVLSKLEKQNLFVKQISTNSPFVDIDLSHRKDLSKSTLKKLSSVNDQVSTLNLSFSNVTDEMLGILKSFDHLRSLQLQGTSITNKTVGYLKRHEFLRNLNLYNTKVDDGVMEDIMKLSSLQSLYLWQTKVTQEALSELKIERPLLKVHLINDPDLFGTGRLKPPVIIAEQDMFKDTLEVELKLNFKDVQMYYTLDGREPDSTSSLYIDPLVLDQTTLVRVRSYKDGWTASEIAERQFVQSKYQIAKIDLSTNPADRYKGKGSSTLVDYSKGTTAFTDGSWLGFEGKNLTATIDLGQSREVKGLTISALEAVGSWIFFPRGLKIYASNDGNKYDLLKETRYESATGIEPAELRNFSEEVDPLQTRFLKVEVQSQLKNPDWHPNPGGKSWLFIDEIIVD